MQKILTSSRYIILVAVIGSYIASIIAFLSGGIRTIQVILTIFEKLTSPFDFKGIVYSLIELVDFFLIGTVFYIIALGLYELFIDDRLELPEWLVIRDLDDLKAKLISGIILIMGVYFLGELIHWDGQSDILQASIGIALVIAALTFFLFVKSRGHSD
jgi:uncharacterized membrane protein YqhA